MAGENFEEKSNKNNQNKWFYQKNFSNLVLLSRLLLEDLLRPGRRHDDAVCQTVMILSVRLSPQICWFSPSSHYAQKPHQICWLSHRCGPAAQGGRGQPVTTLRSLRHFSLLLSSYQLSPITLSLSLLQIYTLSPTHNARPTHTWMDGFTWRQKW